jgi:C4-type Zn-finger protein
MLKYLNKTKISCPFNKEMLKYLNKTKISCPFNKEMLKSSLNCHVYIKQILLKYLVVLKPFNNYILSLQVFFFFWGQKNNHRMVIPPQISG